MDMEYPVAVLEKAQRLEQLLLRVASGEPLDEVNEALDFDLDEQELSRQQAKYEAGGRTWEALIDGQHGHPREAHSALREWMYERKREDESLTAGELAVEIEEQFQVELSIGHINYLLRKVELAGPRGRPYRRREEDEESEATPAPKAESDEVLDNGGTFFPRSSEAGDENQRGRCGLSRDKPPGVPGDKPENVVADRGERT